MICYDPAREDQWDHLDLEDSEKKQELTTSKQMIYDSRGEDQQYQ